MVTVSETSLTKVSRTELLRLHYTLQQGAFVSETRELPGGVAAHSDVTPIPMWNHSAWLGSGDFAQFLAASSSYHNAHNRRPVIYVPDSSISDTAALASMGYERFDQEAWMVYEHGAATADLPPDYEIVHAQSGAEIDEFVRIFYAAYQVKEPGYALALKRHRSSDVSMRHYVMRVAGAAVSVGSVARQDKKACIYNLGTPPWARKKGYAGHLLRHLLAATLSDGCATVFLQVEHNSPAQGLYEKLGFRTQFVRHGFRLANWTAAIPIRSRLSTLLGSRPAPGASIELLNRETKAFSGELSQSIDHFCRSQSCSHVDLFTGALVYLLHRYTAETQISFGLNAPETAACRGQVFSVDRHKPASHWIKELAQNSTSRVSDSEHEVVLSFSKARQAAHFQTPSAPLELMVWGAPPGGFDIHYRTNSFAKDSIRRMTAHLLMIIQGMIESPHAPLCDLELLTPQEKHQLLVDWNLNRFEPTDLSLNELFELQVEKTPDAVALLFAKASVPDAGEQLTYRQLNRRANRLAHRLQALGVGPETFVGVCMERSLDMIVSLLAICKAGGACVPLDPAYPPNRIAFMLQDARAPVIVTQSHLADALHSHFRSRVICLDREWEGLSRESEKNPSNSSGAENAAYIIYTSGSTGQPKGVVIPNSAIANHCIDCRKAYGLSPKDRVLQFSSFNFDASFEQILAPLISGACLVVRNNEVWNTREFARKLQDLQLTVADIPTAYWHELADDWFAHPEAIPQNSLRLVIVGGEAPAVEKLALWQQTAMNQVRLINAYGPTETTITATSYEIPPRKNGEPAPAIVPIGRPRGDRTAYVLDPYGTPTPIGAPGELHIGGGMLARGYHNRPELTAARFFANPFSDDADARLYKTGDIVRYLEDGNLEFLGRVDDQVKVRGFRIELGEIETILCQHPAVREAIVLARPDASGEKRLVAYVTSGNHPPEPRELRGFLKRMLPEYMLPSIISVLQKWPLTPSGKIDRRALPEPKEDTSLEGPVRGPSDPLELQIQLLFERVLKKAPIGVDVSFFEIGGDSLQALELLVEIERATGKNLPLSTLYQSSTIEALAREVRDRAHGEDWSSLVPLQAGGQRPPLFLLHTTPGDILGYGNLVYRLGDDQPCYGFQSLGLKEARLAHSCLEDMARYYVDLLQDFQPHGPYYLGGWCYGGIVAVEMARLLKARGEEIALLALLETVAMAPALSNFRYYLHRLKCSLGMGLRRWLVYVHEKLRYAREARIANKMRFRQVDAGQGKSLGEILDPRLAKLEHVYNTNLKALSQFRSSYYDGKVTLFNAIEVDPAIVPDREYGWVGLAREIEIHEVPGNHDTMLFEPNVSALAQELKHCLQHAQERSELEASPP